MHILIVDDEALARARLRTLLGDCAHGPHHIQEAADGEQALQMLQAAIEKVGKIDNAAIIKELQTGTFDTIMGKIKLADNIMPVVWWVGQWQGGEFVGLAPAKYEGAKPPLFPKPAWTP